MIPAPMPPAFTPNPPLVSEENLLPKLTPAHGFTHPSARATLGALTSATVAESTIALMKPRITHAPLLAVEAPPGEVCKAYARHYRRGDSDAQRFLLKMSVRTHQAEQTAQAVHSVDDLGNQHSIRSASFRE